MEKQAKRGDLVLIARIHSATFANGERETYRTFLLGVAERVNVRGRVISFRDHHGPNLVDPARDVVHVANSHWFSEAPASIVASIGHLVQDCDTFQDARGLVAPYLKRAVAA
jgi:hypothetical protein